MKIPVIILAALLIGCTVIPLTLEDQEFFAGQITARTIQQSPEPVKMAERYIALADALDSLVLVGGSSSVLTDSINKWVDSKGYTIEDADAIKYLVKRVLRGVDLKAPSISETEKEYVSSITEVIRQTANRFVIRP